MFWNFELIMSGPGSVVPLRHERIECKGAVHQRQGCEDSVASEEDLQQYRVPFALVRGRENQSN